MQRRDKHTKVSSGPAWKTINKSIVKQTVLVKLIFYYMLKRECRARWRLTASSLATFWREVVRGGGAAEDKTALLSCRTCGDFEYSSTRETIRFVAYP